MKSIRSKMTTLTVCTVLIALVIVTAIGAYSIKKLGSEDADQMLHLTAETGAKNMGFYFESVENTTKTIGNLVEDDINGSPIEDLGAHVDRIRTIFSQSASRTNGVLTYYFRVDPEVSKTVKGFWYVKENGVFKEHAVTDITQYDTNNTNELVWFTVPKATGKGLWLPPYRTENLGTLVVSYNVPVYWHDRFIGVVGMEIDYETLADVVKNVKIFDTGYAFVVDEKGQFMYHPKIKGGQNPEVANIHDSEQVIGENHSRYLYDGVWREAVWAPLANGMRLYVTAPVSEIDGRWWGMLVNMLIASLLILLAAAWVMMRFSTRLTKPLSELTEAAKQAQKGNYDYELTYDKDDEVGILTRTFKQLTANTRANLTAARKMADVDALTGIKNKHAYTQWEEKIDDAIAKGEQKPFAVVVCDINNLKDVNDLYGHQEGDTCIKNGCMKICGIFSHSPVFRIGGDEFAVILSGDDYYGRVSLMDQINAVPKDPSKIRFGETISAGMAEYDPERHNALAEVFEEADKAMYDRKQYLKETVLPEHQSSEDEAAYEYIPVIHARKQVLIVEDLETNRETLGNLLKDDYDVLYAADGEEALAILREHGDDVDLVLLDWFMPKMNGREVMTAMHVDEELMAIPVIFLSAYHAAELDCLKSGALDFIPKPFPEIEIVKARIAKCIELSEDRDLIRYTERDKLTGLLNNDYFIRYVGRLDHVYKDETLDAVVCDINRFRLVSKEMGRQFGEEVLKRIAVSLKKLARKTGGVCCRQEEDTFLLYCLHQEDYMPLFEEFVSEVLADASTAEEISLRFGVYVGAQREADVEARFARAESAADSIKDDPQTICGFYDNEMKTDLQSDVGMVNNQNDEESKAKCNEKI